ncbi:FecR domain-containing protein [Sorangium sp. So ce1024]|uniref:FecR domain-containing protein n=1 Tax=Sorangium sp. So ce1024 TaxID=3133327 RepID=UPI003F027FBB
MGQSERSLTALGRRVAAMQDRAPAARLDLERGRARLMEAELPGRRRDGGAREGAASGARLRAPARGGGRRAAAWLVAAAALVLSAVAVIAARPGAPMRFELGATEAGVVGAWIAAPAEAELPIRFSDGSVLRLAPGGRARVASVDANGAEIALERGALDVAVVHRGGARWRVRVGPFQVHVIGTRFETRWDPMTERFEVTLREGAITVSGPVVGEARAIRAGERLTVSPGANTVEVAPAATTLGAGSTSVGAEPEPGSTSVGSGSTSVGSGSTSVGSGSTSVGSGSTSVGSGSTSVGSGSTSVGPGSTPVGPGSTSVGPGSTSVGSTSTSVGSTSTSVGPGSTSVGPGSTSVGPGSTSVGSTSTSVGSTSVGSTSVGSTSVGPGSTPVGSIHPPGPSTTLRPLRDDATPPTGHAGAEASPAPRPAAPEAPRWRALALDARYKDALAAAEREGFDALCAAVSAGDLHALGDVARLGGSTARAVQAFTALRGRFPGSPEAASAAFLLGRIAQDQGDDLAGAARWFTLYLTEHPGGAFAADAAGRLVEAEDRRGDEASARRAAERYLAAHPSGSHAAYARRLLARPPGPTPPAHPSPTPPAAPAEPPAP